MITPSITQELQRFLLKTKQPDQSLEPLYFTNNKSTLFNLLSNLLPQNPDTLPSFEPAEEKVTLKPFPKDQGPTFIKNTDGETKPDLKMFVLPNQPQAALTDATDILATARRIYNKFISQTETTPNLIKEITASLAKTAIQQHKLIDHLKTELFAGRVFTQKEYCRTASISLSMYIAQQAKEQRQYAAAMANKVEAERTPAPTAAPKLPPEQMQLIPAEYSYAQFRLSLFSQAQKAQQAAEEKEYEMIDDDQQTNVNPQSGMQCRIM